MACPVRTRSLLLFSLLLGCPSPAAAQGPPLPAAGAAEVRPLSAAASAATAGSPSEGLRLDPKELQQLTGLPPAPGSSALSDDLAVLRWLQANRTPQMVATTWTLLGRDVDQFSPALGVDMSKTTPQLNRGLQAFLALVDQAGNGIKDLVRRPRPYWSHADLKPCLPPEAGFSFPSGHSSWYAAASRLLADLMPERRERLLEIGQHGGTSRVLCGVHYPSDVLAAQRFGSAAAARIISSPQWQRFRSDPAIVSELAAVRAARPEALPLLVR
ncbi:MAG: phosphatase PAP2 family protein [Synechococcaceae cyanobacterium]|nr:phosphatase PAP2 family protein [Synechococcaceae cyanobacterium]